MDDDTTFQSLAALRAKLRRREFLKAAGVGVAATAVGAGSAAAADGDVASDPVHATHTGYTVDPSTLPTPDIPEDPDIEPPEEGSAESEEVPLGRPSGGSGGSGAGLAAQNGTTGSAFGVTTDFDGFTTRDVVRGIDLNDDGTVSDGEKFFSIPSDNQLATGSDYHVTVVNSELGFIEKGAPTNGEDRFGGPYDDDDYITQYRLEDFFEEALSLAPGDEDDDGDGDPDGLQFENTQVFDPRARYDPDSGRFYVACVEFNLPDTNDGTAVDDPSDYHGAFLLAVSSSENPNDPWTVYRVAPEENYGLVDYPTLGYDGEAVYLAENFFGPSFTGATLTVLNKGQLLAGDTAESWEFGDLRNPDGSLAFTLQPAAMPGEADTFHLANSRYGHGKTVTVWDVSVPEDFSAPTVDNGAVSVPPYANSPAAQQPDTSKKIDTLDTRLMNLAWDETTGTLWTAHTTAEGKVRWYELDPEGPSVAQYGTYKVNDWSTFLPTVEADGGTMLMVHNVSSASSSAGDAYAGVGVAGRTGDFEAGVLEDSAMVKHGEIAYNYDDTHGSRGPGGEENVLRWGDYNGVAVDPDGGYWVISQYAKDPTPDEAGPAVSEMYGTRIAHVSFD